MGTSRTISVDRRSRAGAVILGLGATILAISPLTAWVNVPLLGPLRLSQLVKFDRKPVGLVWASVAVLAVVALVAYVSPRPGVRLRVLGLAVFILTAVGAGPSVVHLVKVVATTHGLVTLGVGVWVAGLGELLILIGALLVRPRAAVAATVGLTRDPAPVAASVVAPSPRERTTRRKDVPIRRRRPNVMAAVAIAALLVVALSSYAVGHATGQHHNASTYVINCEGESPEVRPTFLYLACADGGVSINDIEWSAWVNGYAVGSGTMNVNMCSPSCAAGTFASENATVTLSNVHEYHGKRLYERITVKPVPPNVQHFKPITERLSPVSTIARPVLPSSASANTNTTVSATPDVPH